MLSGIVTFWYFHKGVKQESQGSHKVQYQQIDLKHLRTLRLVDHYTAVYVCLWRNIRWLFFCLFSSSVLFIFKCAFFHSCLQSTNDKIFISKCLNSTYRLCRGLHWHHNKHCARAQTIYVTTGVVLFVGNCGMVLWHYSVDPKCNGMVTWSLPSCNTSMVKLFYKDVTCCCRAVSMQSCRG